MINFRCVSLNHNNKAYDVSIFYLFKHIHTHVWLYNIYIYLIFIIDTSFKCFFFGSNIIELLIFVKYSVAIAEQKIVELGMMMLLRTQLKSFEAILAKIYLINFHKCDFLLYPFSFEISVITKVYGNCYSVFRLKVNF